MPDFLFFQNQLIALFLGIVYGLFLKISKIVFFFTPIIILFSITSGFFNVLMNMPEDMILFFLRIGFFTFIVSTYISYKMDYTYIFNRIIIKIQSFF